jgi:hypothetical protein
LLFSISAILNRSNEIGWVIFHGSNNEQERELQSEILSLHMGTRDQIAEVLLKHQIREKPYALRKSLTAADGEPCPPSAVSALRGKSPIIESEERKVAVATAELAMLTSEIEGKRELIEKL